MRLFSDRKEHSILRIAYEKIAGRVSNTTWWRIRSKFSIDEHSTDKLLFIEALAYLRLLNANKRIEQRHVYRFQWIRSNLPSIRCSGLQLKNAIKGMHPPPSDETIRRWGHQIGVPLYLNKQYSEAQVSRWVLKLASQVNFEFKDGQNIRHIESKKRKRRSSSRRGSNTIKWKSFGRNK